MLGFALSAAERGLVPDAFIRFGIRSLLKQRLESLDEGTSKSFESSLPQAPIAPLSHLANEQHYELPPSYFELVLGLYRKYSSGHWEKAKSLDAAEQEMLELTLERAEIRGGMNVLELGCGWGSFLLYAANRFPDARFTGVSNSHSQRESILERARAQNLSNVDVITADFNSFTPPTQYDRIVSIEMFEHLRNYEAAFQKVAHALSPSGKFFMHIFTHRTFSYPFESEGDDNWMGRYFFSGGMMPAHTLPFQFSKDLKPERSWIVPGMHYAKTCEAWLRKHDTLRPRILEIFNGSYGSDSVKWFHRWRLFYLACAELFAFNGGNEWFVSHYLFARSNRDVA